MRSKVRLKEVEASRQNKMVKGRQITYLVYKKFRMFELDSAMLQRDELMNVELKNDNVQQFLTDWDTTCLQVDTLPDSAFLESFFRKQLERLLVLSSLLLFTSRTGPRMALRRIMTDFVKS